MKIVQIPKVYSIKAGDEGEIIQGNPYSSNLVILSISFWGDLFGSTGAEIQLFQPSKVSGPYHIYQNFGGLWEIKVDGVLKFKGFLENSNKDRAKGGNVWTFNLRSVLCAWDVLLANTTFGVTGSGADHIINTTTEYLQYLVDIVKSLSGIQFNGSIPYNAISFSALYEDGILSITSSTYLAEIQRACQALGFVLFAEPVGVIRMIDALNPPPSIIYTSATHTYELLNAGFSVNETSIPATVLVNDDILNIGKSYGHLPSDGISVDDTNFNMTKINNIAFATTVGMKESALPGIAKNIFDISRKASQVLTFKTAGLLTASEVLGYQVSWTDSAGRIGAYTIDYYKSDIAPREMATEIRGYVK